jgi:NAD(P)-dependent dehydrogenase (short-subunit alcohol dehydrogenase family)
MLSRSGIPTPQGWVDERATWRAIRVASHPAHRRLGRDRPGHRLPMRQRHGGRIVNVSSVLGRFALPGSGIYSASKFALEAASDALRLELAPFGVRVVLVQPGVIATPLYARAAAAVNGDEEALQRYRAVWPGGWGSP